VDISRDYGLEGRATAKMVFSGAGIHFANHSKIIEISAGLMYILVKTGDLIKVFIACRIN
jgi:hypothetical protein